MWPDNGAETISWSRREAPVTGCECVVPKAPGGNGRPTPERPYLDAPIPGQCRVSMPEDPETFVTDWALCDVTPPAGAARRPAP